MITQAAAAVPVTLIAAPEGFGKTDRVRDVLAGADHPVVHFYPKMHQTSMFDLLHGFVQSASPVARGMVSSFASAVEYARAAPEPQEELALWVLRHLEGIKAIFVLHELDRVEDRRFLDILRRVIEGAESSVQWIFVARSAPDLPWQDWEAFGLAAAGLTQAQLTLSTRDAVRLADEAGVADARAIHLFELTHGWPLGFKLALKAPHVAESLPLAARTPERLYAHLVRELIDKLDPDLRETLVTASVLAEMDPAFAASAGFARQWPQIAALADEALVAVHLTGGVVKFRDVFRAELQRMLAARGEEAVHAARMNAAHAYEESGRVLTALRLYSAWNLADDVLRLICRHGFDFLELGHASILHGALQTVERERIHQSAVALAIMAMEEARAGRHDIAEAWFLQAVGHATDPAERAAIAYRYVLELVRAGRIDGLSLLEPYADDIALPVDLRASVSSTLATAYVLSERFDDAHAAVERAVNAAEQYGDPVVLAKILHHAAWVALFTGDLTRARLLGNRAVTTAAACSLYDWAARASTVLYNIAYDIEDDPVQSAELLDQILDFGMQAGSAPMRLFALLGKFDLATERGDAQTLQRVERSLLAYELHFSDPMTSAALVSGQALFLAGRGRYAEAYDLLLPTADRQITKDRRALRLSEMALYAAAAGRNAAALEAAEHVEELLPALTYDRRIVRAQANLLLAYRLLHEQERAAALLAELEQRRESLGARARAFVDTVSAVATRWNGVANRSVLANRLETMQVRDLGGYAALLTSLPLVPAAEERPAKFPGPPARQTEILATRREEIVSIALDTCTPQLRQTLLSDLIAAGTVDRLTSWFKDREDVPVIEWAQTQLERGHNLEAAAHLFGDTIAAAVKVLHRERALDRDSEAALAHLRETLDAHLSATQVRLATDLVDPVDPVDAKIDDLLSRLCARDEITFEHSRCVGAWCARLAKRMHLTRVDAQLVMRSGLVHDVGKVLTPAEILKAPRGLTASEWSIMRRHTLDGVRLLEPTNELRSFIPAVRWHHERYDGKGYPDGIPLQDIPFAARIVAVADAFNAMIARRPYREPLSPAAAIHQLKISSGTQFDPAVVSSMIDVVLRPDR